MMQCIALSDLSPAPIPQASVLCLGNFDGVHTAHRELIHAASELRNTSFSHAACTVFCFREPSWLFLQKTPPPRLCTLEQKLKLFASCGAEYVILADFPDLMQLSPTSFAKNILLDSCHAVAAVCGFNYRFGKSGAGNADMLADMLERPVLIKEEIRQGGETVSSTRIRRLLESGDAENASHLLGYPYTLTAKVVHGKALGQKLGSPTLNQYFPDGMLIPRHGVYVTECMVGDSCYPAVSNVGSRPTVESEASVNCETYLLDFSGDLYNSEVSVSFLRFLRPEIRFSSKEKLAEQIQTDISSAIAYFEKKEMLR